MDVKKIKSKIIVKNKIWYLKKIEKSIKFKFSLKIWNSIKKTRPKRKKEYDAYRFII